METTQDKQIREKLNSLDTLPEGYAPSLDSKWELLKTGQTEPKKERPFFWYAAAASLLLLLGFGFLFVNQPTAPAEQPLARVTPEAPAPKTPAVSAPKPTVALHAPNPVKTKATPLPEPENAMPLAAKTRPQPVANTAKTTQTSAGNLPTLAAALPVSETDNLVAAAAPQQQTIRKKKARFVEMDFVAPQPGPATAPATQTAHLNFKLKLLPKTEETGSTVVQHEKPLRLQHTF